MATATIGDLSPQVLARLEEIGTGTFWTQQYEVFPALVEAISDLMLLVGRPTQVVQKIVTIQPNTPWQSVDGSLFCMTNMYSTQGEIYRLTQYDMDFTQIAWGSNWQDDVGPEILQWWPLGFNKFGVHPSLPASAQVQVTGIAITTALDWPYDASVEVPFQQDVFAALEMYAAHYARIKEGGNEFFETYDMYKTYLGLAQRLSEISDRRDPSIFMFSKTLGGQVGINPTTQR